MTRCAMSFAVTSVLVVAFVAPLAAYEPVDIDALREGPWAVVFVVLPELPECEVAIAWLGQLQYAYPDVSFLALSPWITDALEAAASQAELPLALDEDAKLGMILGVDDVPAVVALSEGRVIDLLVWPFEQSDLRASLGDLAEQSLQGPARHVGEEFPLGQRTTLTGETVDLDDSPLPLLLSFFNPTCAPCWGAVSSLVELREEIDVLLVVMAPQTLTEDDREELQGTALTAILDEGGELTQSLSVRSTPTYALRDEKGIIHWVREGAVGLERLRSAVFELMDEES